MKRELTEIQMRNCPQAREHTRDGFGPYCMSPNTCRKFGQCQAKKLAETVEAAQ